MDEFEASVAAGRAAHDRGDHSTAVEQFTRARELAELDLTDLDALNRSAFCCGKIRETLSCSEELYGRLLRDGAARSAAMTALSLALLWITRGDLVVGSGWVNRARGILGSEREGVEHGFLLYLEANLALEMYNTAEASSAAVELQQMARRQDSPTLTSLGLVLAGLAEVRTGHTAYGFAQLDEAMLPVLAENVSAEWAGDIYCAVIHLCHELFDLQRMRAWTAATENWCSRFTNGVMYSGICRIHRLQLRSVEGGWAALEQELERSSAELEGGSSWVAGEGHYQLGELRRLRGDTDGAAREFERARALGIEPQPGEALLQLADGKIGAAWTSLSAALDGADTLARARLLRPAVEVALAHGLVDEAARLCDELEQTAREYASDGFRAWAQRARAALLLHDGRPTDALEPLRSALLIARQFRDRYSTAGIHEAMAQAHRSLDKLDVANANSATALVIYRQLGATVDAARLGAAPAPAGLTPRELEVLGRIAAGASNKSIAAALFISHKTVSRHIANIFGKLGVSSRTAAAAWAHEHGLDHEGLRR